MPDVNFYFIYIFYFDLLCGIIIFFISYKEGLLVSAIIFAGLLSGYDDFIGDLFGV